VKFATECIKKHYEVFKGMGHSSFGILQGGSAWKLGT